MLSFIQEHPLKFVWDCFVIFICVWASYSSVGDLFFNSEVFDNAYEESYNFWASLSILLFSSFFIVYTVKSWGFKVKTFYTECID